MNRILTVTISLLMLAGCSSGPLYDKSAVPGATAAMREAAALCEREHTASKFMACQVAAERNFVVAIHLPKTDAFDAYATQMMALAADHDAGRVNEVQANARATSIRNDYWLAYNDLGGQTYRHPEIMIPGPYGY